MVTDIFLFILGVLSILGGIRFWRKVQRIAKWLSVEAKITKAAIKQTDQPGGSRTSRYEIDMAYDYVIGGKKFSGTAYAPVHQLDTKKGIQKIIDKLPEQPFILVNPENHEEAFYKNTSNIFSWLAIVTGLICLTLFILRMLGLV